jgi:flagellar protein FlgJ
MINQLSPALPFLSAQNPQAKDSPERVKQAAEQFEAILIGQMLKAARQDGSSGAFGSGDDAASQTGIEMAEQQLAGLMAARGGLGLSRLIVSNLEKRSS